MTKNLINVLYADTGIVDFKKNKKYESLFGDFLNMKKLNSYIDDESKKQYLLSCYLVYLMCKENNINCDEFVRKENKKPYIKKNKLFLSISHKKNIVALAYSKINVAIDVEFKNKEINWKEISKNHFSKEENKTLDSSTNKINKFYEMWCIQECSIKLQSKSSFVSFNYWWKNNWIFCIANECIKNKTIVEYSNEKFVFKKIKLIK